MAAFDVRAPPLRGWKANRNGSRLAMVALIGFGLVVIATAAIVGVREVGGLKTQMKVLDHTSTRGGNLRSRSQYDAISQQRSFRSTIGSFRSVNRQRMKPVMSRWQNKYVFSDLSEIVPKGAQKHDDSPRRIVVCLDGSPQCASALNWCIKKLFAKGDEVQLLHVFEFAPETNLPAIEAEANSEPGISLYCERAHELQNLSEKAAVDMMRSFQQHCVRSGILDSPPSITILRGSCNPEICEYAEMHSADMLVVASRGYGKLKRFLMGSTSGFCVNNCDVPVLVVKDQVAAPFYEEIPPATQIELDEHHAERRKIALDVQLKKSHSEELA